MKFAKISLLYKGESQGSYIENLNVDLDAILGGIEPGNDEMFLIEPVEMTQEEVDVLPEFMGW